MVLTVRNSFITLVDEKNKSIFLIVESPVDAPNKQLYFTVFFPEERRLKSFQYFHFCAMLFTTLEPDASSQADKKCKEAKDA